MHRHRRRLLCHRRRARRHGAWAERLRPRRRRRRSGLVSRARLSRNSRDRAASGHRARRDQGAGRRCSNGSARCRSRRCSRDAIRLAEDGFAVHPARRPGTGRAQPRRLRADEGGAAAIISSTARRRRSARATASRRWPRPCARSRSDGAKAFYEGAIAAEIAATVRKLGGFLSEADLAANAADWVEPICGRLCRPRRAGDSAERPRHHGAHHVPAAVDGRAGESIPTAPSATISRSRPGRLAYSVRDHMVADPRR